MLTPVYTCLLYTSLAAVASEVSRAIEAGEWVAAVVDDDKEEGALFGLTRTLWLATSKGLLDVYKRQVLQVRVA